MARYSVEPWDRIFVKGYGFLSFTKKKKKLPHAEKSAINALRTSFKRVIQKTAYKNTKVSKNLQ